MASPSLVARVLAGSPTSTQPSYDAVAYTKTTVPTARELHMLNRMGCGFTPALLSDLRAAGSPAAWFEKQLTPSLVPESARAAAARGWFPELFTRTPAQKWRSSQRGGRQNWEYARDFSNYSLLRRMYSRRTVLESMVLFWTDHLHVNAGSMPAFTHRAGYDAVIRKHALGRFEDLLIGCTLHPAMLLFLDNWRSVKGRPNENHGRELLELHTVGPQSGYTERMIKDTAKILSGYTVAADTWTRTYQSTRHTTGPVSVLGFKSTNGGADGSALTVRFLRYLARHPATARHICHKLAVRFVSDEPSDALVNSLAATYRSSGTSIAAVLQALVRSDEFWASAGQKIRTPADDLVQTYRVLDAKVTTPVTLDSGAHVLSGQLDSTPVAQWPTPQGPTDRGEDWSSPSRMLSSLRMHWCVAGAWWPKQEVVHKAPTAWMPEDQIRFDYFVDHLSRVILGRRSTGRLLQACCEGTGIHPSALITSDHALMNGLMVRLLGVLLDSPAHMTR